MKNEGMPISGVGLEEGINSTSWKHNSDATLDLIFPHVSIPLCMFYFNTQSHVEY